MFREGGNAVDAAVAAAFAQCVLDPLNCSIGGFGVAQVRPAGAPTAAVISFHGRAPLRARPDMFEPLGDNGRAPLAAGTFRVTGDKNQIGYLAPTVPGTLRGLATLLERHDRLPLGAVLAPAIAIARNGWVVSADHWAAWTRRPPAARLDNRTRLCATPAAAAIFTRDGALYEIGQRIVNPDYARTLTELAATGADSFYEGAIADAIAADFAANGGIIGRDDLTGYALGDEPLLTGTFHDYHVTSAPPPAGGLVLLELLNLLEGFDLTALGHNTPAYVHVVTECMRTAFADMEQYLGDPEFAPVPVERLLSKEYADEQRSSVVPRRAGAVPVHDSSGGDTTQVRAVDAAGTCVSITHSLGAASGVVTPGLGFIYNGQMHRFDPVPGRANSIAPGKRRVTGMAPTIVWKGERPVAVLGAAGGNSIINGVLQTILNRVVFGMDALAAVSAPRFHCEGGLISLEGRFPQATAQSLSQWGHEVALLPYSYERMLSAAVQAVFLYGSDAQGGADPRTGGGVMREGE